MEARPYPRAMSETVIRGGLVATVEATFRADIGIDEGRISVIAERVEGAEVIDAGGCIVVPGGIDVHTHFDTELGDSRTADDYESGSRAAAFGGITTYVNYAFQGEGESLAGAIEREAQKAAQKSYVDYSFHPVITRVDDGVLGEFESIRDDGFTSVKIFTAVPGFQLADDDVLAVLRRAASTGVLVNVHAEDGALIEDLTTELLVGAARRWTRSRSRGRTSPRGSRPRSSASTAASCAVPFISSTSRRSRRSRPRDARGRAAPRSISRRVLFTSSSTRAPTASPGTRRGSSSPGRRCRKQQGPGGALARIGAG